MRLSDLITDRIWSEGDSYPGSWGLCRLEVTFPMRHTRVIIKADNWLQRMKGLVQVDILIIYC